MLNFKEWLEARHAPVINSDVKKWVDAAEKLKITIEKLKAAVKKKEEEKPEEKPVKKKPEEEKEKKPLEKKPEPKEKLPQKPEKPEPKKPEIKRPEKPKQEVKPDKVKTVDDKRRSLPRKNISDRQADKGRDKEVYHDQD